MLDASVPFPPPRPPSPWRPLLRWALPVGVYFPLLPFVFSAPLYFVSAGGIVGPTRTWLLLGSSDFGYCLAAYYFAALALSVLCPMFVVGKRIPGSLLFGIALMPFLAGSGVALWRQRATLGETDLKAFGVALNFVEGMLAHGSLLTCTTLWLVVIAALLRLFTIRRPVAGALPPRSCETAMAIGGAAAVVGWIVAVMVRRELQWFQMPYGLWLVVFTVPVALLVAWRAPVARTLAPEAAADMVRAMVLIAVALTTAAMLTGVAGGAYARHLSLEDLGRLYVPLDKQDSLLTMTVAGLRAHPRLAAVDAGVILVALLVVPLACSGAVRRPPPLRLSQLAWLPLLVLAVAPGVMYARIFTRTVANFGRPRMFAAAGVHLPTTSSNGLPLETPSIYFVSRDGQLRIEGPNPHPPGEHAALAIDGGARFGAVMHALAPVLPSRTIASYDMVLSLPEKWQPDRPDLGEFAPLVGTGLTTRSVDIVPDHGELEKRYILAVDDDEEWASVVQRVESSRPLRPFSNTVVIGRRAK